MVFVSFPMIAIFGMYLLLPVMPLFVILNTILSYL
jgi:hypothetical protein